MKAYKNNLCKTGFYTLVDNGTVYVTPLPVDNLNNGTPSFLNSIEDIIYTVYYTGGEVQSFDNETELLNYLNS